MKVPPRLREIDFWIERIGVPIAFAGFLCYLLFVRFEKVDRKFARIFRNQQAIMQKLGVQPPAWVPTKDE